MSRALPLTRYLVAETEIFRDAPLVIVDLGSRGGFNSEWQAFGDCVRIYGFEADEAECARLNVAAAPSVTYLPWAIGGYTGQATLYEAKLSYSTGLYRSNMDYLGRFLNRDNGIVVAERQVSLRTLQEVMAELGVVTIDFIKLDVEGAELDILRGSEAYLRSAMPLGLLSEVRFHPEINNSPIFSSLDTFLQSFGYRLYDLDYSHQSRAALPYPGLADYRLPSGGRFFAYTTHGQIQDGNALYFRDLLLPVNADALSRMTVVRLLKLAALFELYCLSDCAAELILATRHRLAPAVDCDRLLDLLASGISGRTISYRDYITAYFAPTVEKKSHSLSTAPPTPTIAELQQALAKVHDSTSWRITKPLRYLKWLISGRRDA
jgi:FkbM family methyltransferase